MLACALGRWVVKGLLWRGQPPGPALRRHSVDSPPPLAPPTTPTPPGLMHLRGWGVASSVKKAVALWDQAAAGGHLLASYDLAMLHLGGHTEPRGGACPAAVKLLKAVAERGFPAQQVRGCGGGGGPAPRAGPSPSPFRVCRGAQLWRRARRTHHHYRTPCLASRLLLLRAGLPSPPSVFCPLPRHPPPTPLHQEANDDFMAGDYEWALLNYLKAAGEPLQPRHDDVITCPAALTGAAGRPRACSAM